MNRIRCYSFFTLAHGIVSNTLLKRWIMAFSTAGSSDRPGCCRNTLISLLQGRIFLEPVQLAVDGSVHRKYISVYQSVDKQLEAGVGAGGTPVRKILLPNANAGSGYRTGPGYSGGYQFAGWCVHRTVLSGFHRDDKTRSVWHTYLPC